MTQNPRRPPPDFDPLAPETIDSPYATYADLRRRCPVAHADAWNGFWALTCYEDVKQAATVHATASVSAVPTRSPNRFLRSRKPSTGHTR